MLTTGIGNREMVSVECVTDWMNMAPDELQLP